MEGIFQTLIIFHEFFRILKPMEFFKKSINLISHVKHFQGYIIMDHAVIDPDQAYQEALGLTKYDDGNTKSNTLYWIATRGGNL